MEYFVNLIDICKMAAVAVGVIVFCASVKKERAYSRLDKLGVVLNIVLSVLYVPLSLAGVCMMFFADNPSGLSSVQLSLLYAGIYCGISIPAGIDPASNMPIAAQIMAPALGEASMLKAAAAFMRA